MSQSQTIPRLRVGAKSDIGRVREEQQDRMSRFKTPLGEVFLVADGMGGHRGGATAAALVVEGFEKTLQNCPRDMPPKVALQQAATVANAEIFRQSTSGDPEVKGMGSTVVLALVSGGQVIFAHAGDSRAYLFRDGRLTRATRDHSVVQKYLDHGILKTEKEAREHPESSKLTRAMGTQPTIELEVSEPMVAQEGDGILLCSDGLCGYMDDAPIEDEIRAKTEPQAAVEALLGLALVAGGEDNVTLQFLQFGDRPPLAPLKRVPVLPLPMQGSRPAMLRPSNIKTYLLWGSIAFVVLMAGLLAGWLFFRGRSVKLAVLYSDKAGIEDLKSEFSSRELPFSIVQIEEKDAKGFFSRHAERQLFFLKKSMDDANALAEAMDIPSRKPMPKEFATKHPDISLLLVEGTETPPPPPRVGASDNPDNGNPSQEDVGTGEEVTPAPGGTDTDPKYAPAPPPAETPGEKSRREAREKQAKNGGNEAKSADQEPDDSNQQPRVIVYGGTRGTGIPALDKIKNRLGRYLPQPISACPPVFQGKEGRRLFFKNGSQEQAREIAKEIDLPMDRCKVMNDNEASYVTSYNIVIIDNPKVSLDKKPKGNRQNATEGAPPDAPPGSDQKPKENETKKKELN